MAAKETPSKDSSETTEDAGLHGLHVVLDSIDQRHNDCSDDGKLFFPSTVDSDPLLGVSSFGFSYSGADLDRPSSLVCSG